MVKKKKKQKNRLFVLHHKQKGCINLPTRIKYCVPNYLFYFNKGLESKCKN